MLLFFLILSIRHLLYDKGLLKSSKTEIPSLCVGNLAVGGTGKTPMVELVIRTLKEDEVPSAEAEEYGFVGSLFDVPARNIAVLSRGYRRKLKGFQVVKEDGSALLYGDEPLQIKRKFPDVNVVVDENRVEAADLLAHPTKVARLFDKRCNDLSLPSFPKADIIILDDAFQYRSIIPTKSVLLTTYDRPSQKDFLLPLGRLRDLRCRMKMADMIVVTKCPLSLEENDRARWASTLELHDFNLSSCTGVNKMGKKQKLLFATTLYDSAQPVFADGDHRYVHSKMAILFSGIADDRPLRSWVSESYRIVAHEQFPDHHVYGKSDIEKIEDYARHNPTAIILTTEKDAQRLNDCIVSANLRNRMFYIPIRTMFLTAAEQAVFKNFLSHL